MKNGLLSFYIMILAVLPVPGYASDDPRIYIALDTSGSMEDELDWFANTISSLRESSQNTRDFTDSIVLYSFTDKSERRLKGDDAAIIRSIDSLEFKGGDEDGLIAIEQIIESINPNANAQIILITDEDRDDVKAIDTEELLGKIIEKNVRLHITGKYRLICENARLIGVLAKDAKLIGVSRELEKKQCAQSDLLRGAEKEYIELALRSGGGVWDIDHMKNHSEHFGEYLAADLAENDIADFGATIVVSGGNTTYTLLTFDAGETFNPSDVEPITTWDWDFGSDGSIDYYGPVVDHIFYEAGVQELTLRLSNNQFPLVQTEQKFRLVLQD